MCLRKSQVGRKVGIDLSQTIGRLGGGIVYDDFRPLPLIYVISYKSKLFHNDYAQMMNFSMKSDANVSNYSYICKQFNLFI